MDIGIIGGADGPTSIFVASSLFWPLSIGVLLAVVGLMAFALKRR
jgi:Na+-transporting methylmalonyl-CoA/oxaloacetate decarboxylase beta subunit